MHPKIHTYSRHVFDRLFLLKAYDNIELISGTKEHWLDYFPEFSSQHYSLFNSYDQFSDTKTIYTHNIFDCKSWKKLHKKLNINHLLVYKPFAKKDAVEKKYGLNILSNDYELFSKLENKVSFRQKFNQILPFPDYEFSSTQKLGNNVTFQELKSKYTKFVIQDEKLSGGRGTYIVDAEQDFSQALQSLPAENRVVISQYIKGESASVQACIFQNQVINTGIQKQLVGQPSLTNNPGQFVGGQWCPKDYSQKEKRQVQNFVKKTGEILIKLGYRGIFGLDLIVDHDKEQVFVIEMNARITGVTYLINMIQTSINQTPIIYPHILSLLKTKPKEKIKNLCPDISQANISYLILTNKKENFVHLKQELKPGVYRYSASDKRMIHQKISFDLNDLQSNDQFMLVDIPNVGRKIKPHNKRLIRFIKKGPALEKGEADVNQQTQQIIKLIRDKFTTVD